MRGIKGEGKHKNCTQVLAARRNPPPHCASQGRGDRKLSGKQHQLAELTGKLESEDSTLNSGPTKSHCVNQGVIDKGGSRVFKMFRGKWVLLVLREPSF